MRCFIDFEFTSTGKKKKDLKNDNIELISIGMIVTDYEDNTLLKYYNLVKPVKNEITDYCRNLTGLTNEDINKKGISFKQAIDDVLNIIDKYNIKEVYNFGRLDSISLNKSAQLSRYESRCNLFVSKLKNIEFIIGKDVIPIIRANNFNGGIGLSDFKKIYGLNNPITHNALKDAIDLKNVYLASKDINKMNIKYLNEYINRVRR